MKRTCDAASQVRATACWTQPRWVASVVAGFSQQAGIDGDAHSDFGTRLLADPLRFSKRSEKILSLFDELRKDIG